MCCPNAGASFCFHQFTEPVSGIQWTAFFAGFVSFLARTIVSTLYFGDLVPACGEKCGLPGLNPRLPRTPSRRWFCRRRLDRAASFMLETDGAQVVGIFFPELPFPLPHVG